LVPQMALIRMQILTEFRIGSGPISSNWEPPNPDKNG
jgi:hypothetical protein